MNLRQEIMKKPIDKKNYVLTQDLILMNNRIWLPKGINFIQTLLQEYHNTHIGGHMGIKKTLARLRDNYVWSEMHEDVRKFILTCIVCQQTKYEAKKPAELFRPLAIPSRLWEDLSLDFIVGLPPYRGNTTIFGGS